MARSLLQKHLKKSVGEVQQKVNVPELRQVKPRSDILTDADWYHIHSFWRGSLFNPLYLKDDFQRDRERKLHQYEQGFQTFLNQFLNLCDNRRSEKFHTWNEDQTVRSWIMPVMEALGWWDSVKDPVIPELTFTVQDSDRKRTYRPDCVFVSNQKLKGAIQEKDPEDRVEYARRYIILTLEAKYWDRISKYEKHEDFTKPEQTRLRKDDSASCLSPSGQILAYLKHLKNDDPVRNHFGIVTDGKIWRLHHVDKPEDKYFEFDLGDLFFEVTSGKAITDITGKQYSHIEEAARYFYYIFSKDSLFSESNEPTLVDNLLAYSKKYVEQAEQNLKDRFLTAMKYACNGFLRAYKQAGLEADLEEIRNVAEAHIFNILFLKSCEAKGVIHYGANSDVSITATIERIAQFDPNDSVGDATNEEVNLKPAFKDFEYKNSGYELHSKILKLTELVEQGGRLGSAIEIVGFKESIFTPKEKKVLQRCYLNNIETVKLLHQLSYMEEGKRFRQIPYSIFTPEQLGSIYESFLEFKLSKAEEDLEFIKRQWSPITKRTLEKLNKGIKVDFPIARKGELFFTPDNEDRKATGTYYTPDYIVKYIVEQTIAPMCKGIGTKELLKIKVCDPAMGSGHFLTGALRFLTEKYLECLQLESATKTVTMPQAKRQILDTCIFGVDINPRAVRLAKLALWLETAQAGMKLERLDDQLKCGDTLVSDKKFCGFNWQQEFFKAKGFDGFSVCISNPPYQTMKGKENSHKMEDYIATMKDAFSEVYEYKGNVFNLFLVRGLGLVKPGGRLGFIVPGTLISNKYFNNTRDFLKNSVTQINKLSYEAFDDAVTGDTVLLFLEKNSSLQTVNVSDCKDSLGFPGSIEKAKPAEIFKSDRWLIASMEERQLLKVIEDIPKLGETFDIKNGINTGNMAEFLIAEKKETKLHRPFIEGKDILPFKLQWRGLFVNYDPDLWKKVPIEKVKGRQKKHDYALRKPELFNNPKVFVRQTGDKPIAAYDEKSFYSRHSTHLIINKEKTDVGLLKALVCLLNSQIYAEIYNILVGEKGRTFAEVKTVHLEKLPFPKISKDQITELVKLHDLIANSKEEKSILAQKKKLESMVVRLLNLEKTILAKSA